MGSRLARGWGWVTVVRAASKLGGDRGGPVKGQGGGGHSDKGWREGAVPDDSQGGGLDNDRLRHL